MAETTTNTPCSPSLKRRRIRCMRLKRCAMRLQTMGRVSRLFPVHGLDRAMGVKSSKVGWFSFIGGVIGLHDGHVDDLVHECLRLSDSRGRQADFSPFSAFPPSYD